jgi:protein-tyrosine phosphatase
VPNRPVRICFVCSGNICRSPTAEVVLRRLTDEAGVTDQVEIDSAGTGSWHAGDDMDRRSRSTLEDAGYIPAVHSAKQFVPADFAQRDLVLALDAGHHNVLWWLAAETPDPAAARAKIVMLRSFDLSLSKGDDLDVPDPYYGRSGGFTEVLAQIERACAGLLDAVTSGRRGQQAESPPL